MDSDDGRAVVSFASARLDSSLIFWRAMTREWLGALLKTTAVTNGELRHPRR
jgi:hypothetical protein